MAGSSNGHKLLLCLPDGLSVCRYDGSKEKKQRVGHICLFDYYLLDICMSLFLFCLVYQ